MRRRFKPPTDDIIRIKYESSSAIDIGMRNEQQDCFTLFEGINSNINTDFLAVLCDGMGGLEGGSVASHTAVKAVSDNLKNVVRNIPDELYDSILNANLAVLSEATRHGGKGTIGTTLLSVVFKNGEMYWSSVGDSRIFLVRDEMLIRVNHRQHYLKMLMGQVADGKLTRKRAEENPDAMKLVSFIGHPDLPLVEISEKPFTLRVGDGILLCSDGLFDTLTEKEIEQVINHMPVAETASELVLETLSRKNPIQDNVSVIYIKYRGESND